MGLFDFVKNAGKKIILGPHAASRSSTAEAKAAPSGSPASESEQKATAAIQLKQYIEHLNLGVTNVNVRLEGDKAILEGDAPSQEAVEKTILAVGNTAGIAQVESNLRTPAGMSQGAGPASGASAQQTPRFYTVKDGDTLSSIAKRQLGDAKRYPEIFEANRPLLKDPDEIYPGQNLRLPA